MEDNFIITSIKRVILVGKDEYPERLTSFKHDLGSNELIFNFSGRSTVCFNGTELENLPGTIRFLPKGPTKQYDVLRHEWGECIDVFFDTDKPISATAFVKSVASGEKIGNLFKRIFAVWVSKEKGYYFEAISLLYRIFAELERENRSPKKHTDKIAPAIELIHTEFLKREIPLEELSRASNMCESYFQRLFKEKYGISPKKYIIQLKINHACDLLRLERYTVTQIAELCNFSDVYFFSRQFKEYTGITPTQFIKKYRST
jgi:AraC-like DNA-binding protein